VLASTILLSLVILGCAVVPAMGQGVTAGYTLFVRFFFPLPFLYNIRVTVGDQAGRIVGNGFSSDGRLIIIPVRTETATISLTVTASGIASAGPLTDYLANPAFWPVSGRSTIPVQVTGGDYWVTIVLGQ
jgi:hypothetical protein